MGRHIILLNRTKKESIDLGKILSNRSGFQMDNDKICAFLASWLSDGHKVEITNDYDDLPEYEEEGWKEVESF